MSFPTTYRAIREIVRRKVLQSKTARDIVRKSGFRPSTSTTTTSADVGGGPILTLVGITVGQFCSLELQVLIDAYDANPTTANRNAVMDYIEAELGQSIAEAYPTEWAAAQNGTPQTIEIDLGSDIVTLTLGAVSTEDDYEVGLGGNHNFDITSNEFSHPDNDLAWTTGYDIPPPGSGEGAEAYAYATAPNQSESVHLAKGQTALQGITNVGVGQPVNITAALKQWRKSPRRILNTEAVVTVPSNPTSSDPVRVNLKWSGSSPRHGEFIRSYTNNAPADRRNQTWLFSEVGPPIYFGVLLRSDAQVAAGHPLTDWWFQLGSNNFFTPLDAVNTSGASLVRFSGVGSHKRTTTPLTLTSTDSEIEAEFDDFYASIYANERTGARDFNPTGEDITLTTDPSFRGWACFWWWHPTEDWYWQFKGIQGFRQASYNTPSLAPYFHNLLGRSDYDPNTSGDWNQFAFRNAMNRHKLEVPSGSPNETVEYFQHGPHFLNNGDPDLDWLSTHNWGPSVLGRGPWVRIAPGETGGVLGAQCITSGWPGGT